MQTMSPDTLCVEVTTRCPQRCVHCSACASPERTEMLAPSSLKKFLGTLPQLQEIYLSGGEPFEHPDLESLLAVATEKADRVVIYSSGVVISRNEIAPLSPVLLANLAAGGIQRIDISIYSEQPALHEAITATPGSLAVTLESAHRIRTAGIELGIHFVPLAPVEGCLMEVASIAESIGAARLHILAPVYQGRAIMLGRPHMSSCFLTGLRGLQTHINNFELVLSSAVRDALDCNKTTRRDGWQTGFIDIRGFYYPGEGLRLPEMRSAGPIGSCWREPGSSFNPSVK